MDEDSYLAQLVVAMQGLGTKVVVFDGKLSIAETAKLFSRASTVVGVHGAAFANIILCDGSTLGVELAFSSPYTQHYAYTASALGLEYTKITLDPNSRGVGTDSVSIPQGEWESAISMVETHVRKQHAFHKEL